MIVRKLHSAIFVAWLVLGASVSAQPTYYVDASATGANNGSSWDDAFTNLQSALPIASYGDEIWVAQGVYKPTVPVNPQAVTDPERNTPFRVLNGVRLYGGFNGTEVMLSDRNWDLYPTILSGDLNGDDNDNILLTEPTRADNSWHVIFMGDVDLGPVDDNTTVDGFTITGGNADPPLPNPDDAGGGIWLVGARNGENINDFSRPLLKNLTFRENTAHFGGGMACIFSEPDLVNVSFINNSAIQDGGGLNGNVCKPELRNAEFRNNLSGVFGGAIMANRGAANMADVLFENNYSFRGGAIYSLLDFTYVVNGVFSNNVAEDAGGAIFFDDSPGALMNSIFTANQANNVDGQRIGGGAIVNLLNQPFLTNNVFYGNTTSGSGGAMVSISSEPVVVNSILWGNQAFGTEDELWAGGAQQERRPIVINNIIQGGLPGGVQHDFTNIHVDPSFTDPDGNDNVLGTSDDDFSLTPASPAIDVGENLAVLFDFLDLDQDGITSNEGVPIDLAGNRRIFDGLQIGPDATIDLGAFEYGAPTIVTDVETDSAELPVVPLIADAYPNPFRTHATVRYELPAQGRVQIRVFDTLGRKVATLVDAFQPAGIHEARFSAPDLASGLYLFHLDVGGRTATRKMMMVK